MSDTSNNAAITAIVLKFRQIAYEYQQLAQRIADHEGQITRLRGFQTSLTQQAQDCHAAARVLNFDLIAVAAAQAHGQAEAPPIDPVPVQPSLPGTKSGTIRDFVLEIAGKAYPKPVRAAELRKQLADSGTPTHEKTIGMTLYRLSKAGLIRREGRDWFFVPQDAEEKNPGGDAPGLL